ncbi:MAG: aminopeptidase P family protein [Chloroflexi bacterium]|nr:aminopeptidase P family protein [Chloroflexota bacterium]
MPIRRAANSQQGKVVDQQRIDIVLQQMDIAAIDVLVCRLPQNVLMLAGQWPADGNSIVVFPRMGDPVLLIEAEESFFTRESWIQDVRTFDVPPGGATEDAIGPLMKDIAREKGMQNLVVGYEGTLEDVSCPHSLASAPGAATYLMLHTAFPDGDFHDATGMLDAAQMVKTPREIASIRIATEIAELGLAAARRNVLPGVRESEIESTVHREVLASGIGFKGASDVQVYARAISGARSSEAYRRLVATDNREIGRGDAVLVEIDVCADGFWSRLSRTFAAGSPSSKIHEVYDACVDAQRKAAEMIADGVKAGQVDVVVRDYITKRGYGEALKGWIGHGIGFNVSPKSRPRFYAGSQDVLRPYMVHTLELGLFVQSLGGVKVGDVVVDLGHGVEFISTGAHGGKI